MSRNDRSAARSALARTPPLATSVASMSQKTDADVLRARHAAVDNEESELGIRCFAVALPFATPAKDSWETVGW